MKKGLCIALSALMIAVSFTACAGVKTGKDNEVVTRVDDDGKVYVEVTDKKGNAVTEKNGEALTSYISDSEKEKISENSSKQEASSKEAEKKDEKDGKSTKKDDKNNKTVAADDIGLNEDLIKGIDADMDMTAKSEELIEEGTTIKKTTLWEDLVKKSLSDGKFTIEMSIKSGDEDMPMKLVFDKDRMYASVTSSGIDMGILMMDNKTYLLLPNLFTAKVYMEYDEAGSMDELFDSFGDMTDSGAEYIGSSKVKDGGKTLTCEEYKNKDGATVKYYFDGKDWVRYELIDGDDIVIYTIKSVSDKVDDSVFSLKGYTKMDTDKLAKLMGNIS